MCGINGVVNKSLIDEKSMLGTLAEMNNLIRHRGPDQDGFYYNIVNNYSIGMAMRRLSIIDLKTGKQPIYSEDKKSVIVFNGEIYNYRKLREQLEADGCRFDTNSDTEVIIKLYERFGTDSFAMLDGMFAFSIYDRGKNKLYIARDFFGEKPLYYYSRGEMFIYASELKSITGIVGEKLSLCKKGLNLFFQLTYIPAPFTIFSDVRKLEANHYIEFDCSNFSFNRIEIIQKVEPVETLSKKQAVQQAHDLVFESVASRSISDVPLGSFLSGGVDSSIVSLCLANHLPGKIDTFSIGFEKEEFDESAKARTVAKIIGSNHHEFIVREMDFLTDLHGILENFDEPFADSSALASYVVAAKTRKNVTVALTGDGGDEVFGGYNKYYIGGLNSKYTALIPEKAHYVMKGFLESILSVKDDSRGFRFKLRKLIRSIDYGNDFYFNIISLGFHKYELNHLLTNNYRQTDAIDYFKSGDSKMALELLDFRNIDRRLSLDGDLLVKVDRTSMLNSLECRAPFLNKELWNFTSQLPSDFLISGHDKKHILKEAFKQYFPKEFLNKSKKGFGVPVGDWLRGSLKSELVSFIEPSFISSQGIFHLDYISNKVNLHLVGKEDNTFAVWTFYCFQKWYKSYYS